LVAGGRSSLGSWITEGFPPPLKIAALTSPRPEDFNGLAVEDYVARLRDKLLPLVEKSHRIARESIEAISRMRQAPSLSVERSEGIRIVLVPIGKG